MFINIILVTAGFLVGLGGMFLALRGKKFVDIERTKLEAENLVKKSTEDSKNIRVETVDAIEKRKKDLELESEKRQERLIKTEELLKNKEELLKKKEDRNREVSLRLASLKEEAQSIEEMLKRGEKELLEKLTSKTGATTEATQKNLLAKYKADTEAGGTERLAKIEEDLKENAEKTAKKLIVNVIQRMCSPTSVETRAVTVIVPKDHIKGKIVGKDGQNIKEFEKLLEVDIVFNDLPNTISISAFMLVKRRVAQRAIEKLINIKGEIDKTVIQKTIKEAEKETDAELYKIGKDALVKMGIKHEPEEFCRVTGRLQYRTSYGQNIMKHSMEVGWVASILGSELNLNANTCKVGGFLHDLGKAIDQDPNVKDAHDYLSKELMEKFGFSWEEVHAAWTHHDAIPQETPEALIVKAADAISAGRPGARQESFDKYIERIKALEEAAFSFEGVKSAFAISAGREVRAIVDPEVITDAAMPVLAKSLAGKIESEIVYPGQIKINIIRKTKHTEIAQ